MIIQSSQVAMTGQSSYKRTTTTQQATVFDSRANGTVAKGMGVSMQTDSVELNTAGTLYASNEPLPLYNAQGKLVGHEPPPEEGTCADAAGKGSKQPEVKAEQVTETKSPKNTLKSLIAQAETTMKLMGELLGRFSGRNNSLRQSFSAQLSASLKSYQSSSAFLFLQKPALQKYNGAVDVSQAQRLDMVISHQKSSISIENSMEFHANAQVNTADGRSINVDLQLNMSQSFYAEHEVYIETAFTDPLVINIGASSAQLSQTKFEFDLDCDGEPDQISKLMNGSGYLALDKNGDGEINDGSELFGAQNGDGFADLAQYDQDGNGWIDEADDIFDKLRIWQHNADGTTSLIGLGEAGVGAIYLGSMDTNYVLGDLTKPDGAIRKSGFFLYETGEAGTMQHVDLATRA